MDSCVIFDQKVENLEIYENTSRMWLERTQQAELVDLEVGEENNLDEGEEVESNMEVENMLNNEVDIEQKDLDKNASNKMLMRLIIRTKKQ